MLHLCGATLFTSKTNRNNEPTTNPADSLLTMCVWIRILIRRKESLRTLYILSTGKGNTHITHLIDGGIHVYSKTGFEYLVCHYFFCSLGKFMKQANGPQLNRCSRHRLKERAFTPRYTVSPTPASLHNWAGIGCFSQQAVFPMTHIRA